MNPGSLWPSALNGQSRLQPQPARKPLSQPLIDDDYNNKGSGLEAG